MSSHPVRSGRYACSTGNWRSSLYCLALDVMLRPECFSDARRHPREVVVVASGGDDAAVNSVVTELRAGLRVLARGSGRPCRSLLESQSSWILAGGQRERDRGSAARSSSSASRMMNGISKS